MDRNETYRVKELEKETSELSGADSASVSHLVGLVEEAASAALQQELDVFVHAAARKLPGQVVSAVNHKHSEKTETWMWRKRS